MKISRLYEILNEYDKECSKQSVSANDFAAGKKRAIIDLIKEVEIENEVLKFVKKERKERNKRLGI